MNHLERVNLLSKGVDARAKLWADFGSGSGAFTLALAELLNGGGEIYSIDTNRRSLEKQRKQMESRFPEVTVHYKVADFTQPLELPPLDGILMANALHYLKNKQPIIESIQQYLKPKGKFLLVEYDTDHGNPWVPHPVSFQKWQALAKESGFSEVKLIGTAPSRFQPGIYAVLNKR